MAKTVLLTGDSIIKHIPDWEYTKDGTPHLVRTECFRGCTTERLKSKIDRNRLVVTGYDIIIIHIGTNDVANRCHNILQLYRQLVQSIKNKNNVAKIIISLPIPRPVDFQTSWPLQVDINNNATWQGRQHGYKTWKTYKPFLSKQRGNQPQQIRDRDMYANDGLHLSTKGTRRLWQQIKLCLTMSDLN